MKDVKNYTDDINDARNKLENSLERAKNISTYKIRTGINEKVRKINRYVNSVIEELENIKEDDK
ncbi:MAG: hypothetical protein AAB475_00920 [Patescibacteria group bacterium]